MGHHSRLTNLPLTERGQHNALAPGERVCRLNFDRVFGGPLVSDWPVAGQQCDQSPARSPCEAGRQGGEARLAGTARAGAGRRPGQRRTRPPGGLLPRFHGHDAASRDGLRPALRIRHVQADHSGRLAAGAAGQLAPPSGSLGGRPPAREGRNQAELLLRSARRGLARDRRQAVQLDRHSL